MSSHKNLLDSTTADTSQPCLPPTTEFTYPASWLADQTLVVRAAQRAEAERSLDPPSLREVRARRRNVIEPVVAFGPPGSR